jgi:hypothetical protein
MQRNIPEISNHQATLLWGLQIRTFRFVWTRSHLLFSTLNYLCTYIILFNSTFFFRVLFAHMCASWIFHENQDATASVRTRIKWEIVVVPVLFCFWHDSPQWARASTFTRFLDHTQWRTTLVRTSLDEWSARRRDLYLTTYDTRNGQTSMPPAGLEPTIPASERPQTYALDRAATEIGVVISTCDIFGK